MNNLLQSLRGVLSALIGFQSPEDGLLEKARRRWNEGRTNRPSLLDEAWEERVMFAVRLSPMVYIIDCRNKRQYPHCF